MIEKMKQGFSSLKEEHTKKKVEKQQEKLKKEAEQLRCEQEKIEKEQNALEAEKQKLLQKNDKELMVELIFAVRGFYTEFQKLKTFQDEIAEALDDVERQLMSLEIDVRDLQGKVDTIDENNVI